MSGGSKTCGTFSEVMMEQQTLQQQRQTRIREKLRRELGPMICTALADADVIEVLVTGQGEVWLDRLSVGKERTGVVLPEAQREMVIGTVAAWHGLVVNRHQPLLKAEVPPDGARFQGMVRPVSAPAFVIRRPFPHIIPLAQYVAEGSMTAEQAAVLRAALTNREKILIAGATLSGKTILANSLVAEVLQLHGSGLRTVLIEDTYEMTAPAGATNCDHLHTCEEADLRTVIQTTMRLSPEFIVVGEVRGPEAWDLLNVWSTGHGASVSTIHADTPEGALRRFAMLIRQAGVEPDHELIGSTVTLIVVMERVGSRHWRIREMARSAGWDGQRYQLMNVT